MDAAEQHQWKKAAAEEAAKLVEDGMVLGLGTGSTAALFVAALGGRLAEDGLRITGNPYLRTNRCAGAQRPHTAQQLRRAFPDRPHRGRRR